MKNRIQQLSSLALAVLLLLPTAFLPAHAAGQDITALFGDGAFAEDVRFPPQARRPAPPARKTPFAIVAIITTPKPGCIIARAGIITRNGEGG